MAKVSASSMIFKPGVPVFVELLAKRSVDPLVARSGTLHIEVEADLNSDDSEKIIRSVVCIKISGTPKNSTEVAFAIECKMECDYFFEVPQSKESIAAPSFVSMLCDPVYQRAAVGAQNLCSQLGFGRINLPLTMPADLKPAIAEKSKSTPTLGSKPKKAISKKKA